MKIFDFLKELTTIITPSKIKSTRHITGNLKRLYAALNEAPVDENELINKLGFQKAYYWKLSKQLKERLLIQLFFVEVDTEIRKNYLKAHLNYAIATILFGLGARKLGAKIAEDILPVAIDYEFTDIAYWFSRAMRYHYAAIPGNQKKFEYYTELTEQLQENMYAEDLAELKLSEVIIHFVQSKAPKETTIKLVQKNIASLNLFKETPTYKFRLFYYNLLVSEKELLYDEPGLIEVCDQSVAFFLNKPKQTPNATIFSFLFKKIPAQIHLADFEAVKASIEHGLSIVHPFDHNWNNLQQYHVIWCFHAGHYAQTIQILQQVYSQERKQDKSIEESWKIYEAFIYYFIESKVMELDSLPPFKIYKFLNSVPIYSKDKVGFNVAIKILEILFLLHTGDRGRRRIIDKTKSLKEYIRVHLSKRKDVARSRIFLKMLLLLPSSSFAKGVVAHKAKPFIKELKSKPLNVARQIKELEIVPYEVLWEMVVGEL